MSTFGLQIAPATGATTLASLTNEDRVTLGVGIAAINGSAPMSVPGQIDDNAITYTAPITPSSSAISLRATNAGLDVRAVLYGAAASTTVVVALAPDPRTQVAQRANGVIDVTRAITGVSTTGTPYVTRTPEYFVELPHVMDSSVAASAPAANGPVTMTLVSGPSGQQNLMLTVDPSWLHDVHRTFPVHVDVPIATAYSAVNTGIFGTVNSCAPSAPAPQADVVVGVDGSCTYHGQVYFDVSSLRYDTPVVSATLRLYTPGQAGPIGIQVFPNATPTLTDSVYQPASWRPPSWDTALAIAPGAAGLAESDNEGHWQDWDVTTLVRQWVQDRSTNGGLTLVGAAAPVRFATPFGGGDGKLEHAPVLNITYAAQPAAATTAPADAAQPAAATAAPAYSDGAPSIYGLSGTFAAECTAGTPSPRTCSGDNGYIGPAHTTESQLTTFTAASAITANPPGPYVSYIRVGVTLSCSGANNYHPGFSWWNSSDQHPAGHNPPDSGGNQSPIDADQYNVGSIYDVLYDAYTTGLTPIVDFTAACSIPPASWGAEVGDFLDQMPSYTAPQPQFPGVSVTLPNPLPMTYFEVGNEVNYTNSPAYGNSSTYASIYDAVAQAVSADAHSPKSRVLTAGMLQPSATADGSCKDPGGNININWAKAAISLAKTHVSSAKLGVAVHPYKYTSASNNGYWRNYYSVPGTGDQNVNPTPYACYDLRNMINLWVSSFSGLPVIFTEDNWTDQTASARTDGIDLNRAEAAYVVDLFTFLYDFNGGVPSGNSGYTDPTTSPIRVAIFRGDDAPVPDDIGLYSSTGTDKAVAGGNFYCGYQALNPTVAKWFILQHINGPCY